MDNWSLTSTHCRSLYISLLMFFIIFSLIISVSRRESFNFFVAFSILLKAIFWCIHFLVKASLFMWCSLLVDKSITSWRILLAWSGLIKKKKCFPQKKFSATKFFPKKNFFQEKFFYQKNFFQKKFFKLVFFRNKIFSKKFLFLKKLILQKKFSKNRIFSAKLRNKSELGYFYYFFVIFYSLLFIQKYIPGSIVYFVLFSSRDFASISITGDFGRNSLKRGTEKLHFR